MVFQALNPIVKKLQDNGTNGRRMYELKGVRGLSPKALK
ncbi:predicted protein [Sclerotinia sclerotiorum 1980 UF-70]|uniref:Uncharacterized protein n=1 Tax=Sclerotinia sclerotiorum (strain ATCC 18683 / 1980 / Ss-1) TaxID=665079 RepID=A7EYY5_SCLS1|nr:predicted protein [Sclerotinia sclerotiorum 1980 UF-70]EDN94677.1 predicted protein [Sclerotinia sclerotiorum 1980 UF-70]